MSGRIERIIELAKQEVGAGFGPGVAAFEPVLAMFGLKGAVADVTKRELLEFSAVRKLSRASKGDRRRQVSGRMRHDQVEDRRPDSADRGPRDPVLLRRPAYAATVVDRVRARYEPELELRSGAKWFLDELEKTSTMPKTPAE